MPQSVAVGIIHASPLVREGLRQLLKQRPELRVAGAFEGAREVLQQPIVGEYVLLYDLDTNHRDGPALMAQLRGLPGAKILIFGIMDDDEAIIDCVRAGASGCIPQGASLEDLVSAVRSLAQGTPPSSPRVFTTLFSYVAKVQAGEERPPVGTLTPREEQILQMLVEGLTNKEIAQRLYLRPQTVKNYVHLVLQKLNLHSRLDVIRAFRSGKR